MCAGAIVNARVPKVYFGASDPKGGAAGGMFDLFATGVNHKPEIIKGVLEDDCAAVLREFFEKKRGVIPFPDSISALFMNSSGIETN